MLTLTQSDTTVASERPLVVQRVQQFTRRLRRRYPEMMWLAVLEWHPGGHGWHVHMVVDRYVPKHVYQALWPHGFVDVRRIVAKGTEGHTSAARKAGQYVAKYLTKRAGSDAPEHVAGDHRYLRPLGMSVTEVQAEGEFADLVTLVWGYFRRPISWLWWSGDDTSWRGPRVLAMRSG